MGLREEVTETAKKLAEQQEQERQRQLIENQLKTALELAGMSKSSPEVIIACPKIQAIIDETFSSMRFSEPKVVRQFPDNVTRTRVAQRSSKQYDHVDKYSFDVELYSQGSGKDAVSYHIWVFQDRSMAIVRNGTANASLQDVYNLGIDINKIREKFIEALAKQQMKGSSLSIATSTSSSSNISTTNGLSVGTMKWKIISIILFLAFEITCGIVFSKKINIDEMLGESAGAYFGVQVGLIIHALAGCLVCLIGKLKVLPFVSGVISAILGGHCFIYAMHDLTGGDGLEGMFTSVFGFFFFGIIALGVIAISLGMPVWINVRNNSKGE